MHNILCASKEVKEKGTHNRNHKIAMQLASTKPQ